MFYNIIVIRLIYVQVDIAKFILNIIYYIRIHKKTKQSSKKLKDFYKLKIKNYVESSFSKYYVIYF